MYVSAKENLVRVRQLRLGQGWSQAQLAELSGLSVRTIQRVENGTNPGLESLRSLATVFGVEIAELQDPPPERLRNPSFAEAVVHTLRHYDDFTGTAGRTEFWWSALAVTLAVALAGVIGPQAQAAVGILVLLPVVSLAVRRLRDAGESPWWLLIAFAPVGGLVALAVLWAQPSAAERDAGETSASRPTPS